jgi:hypothetical protein
VGPGIGRPPFSLPNAFFRPLSYVSNKSHGFVFLSLLIRFIRSLKTWRFSSFKRREKTEIAHGQCDAALGRRIYIGGEVKAKRMCVCVTVKGQFHLVVWNNSQNHLVVSIN